MNKLKKQVRLEIIVPNVEQGDKFAKPKVTIECNACAVTLSMLIKAMESVKKTLLNEYPEIELVEKLMSLDVEGD